MNLTPREMEVLSYICQGYSIQEIADELIITYATSKAHTASILRKLNARNKAHAVRIATLRGIL